MADDDQAPAYDPPKHDEKKPEGAPHSRLGHFIQTYSSFLSSFVIGVAGLCATSLW